MVGLMGWSVQEQGWRKGPWTAEEDKLLAQYVNLHGEGRWSSVARSAGLNRSGKSCRLRWVNYLRPGLKKGQLTPQEEGIIIELHALWGNKWSTIARYLPGRTDNEIKNYWRTHFKNKEKYSKCQQKQAIQTLNRQQQQQKLQQQQQQPMEEQQLLQQQQQQEQELDMTRILTQLHEDGNNVYQAQGSEDMVFMYPTLGDQSVPVMFQDAGSFSTPSLVGEDDGGLWGALWNLDDVYSHVLHTYCGNKITT